MSDKQCPACKGARCDQCSWQGRVKITRSELVDRLSQPVPFFRENSTVPEFWACGHCGSVHPYKYNAFTCYTCAPRRCTGCDEWVPARDYCRPCAEKRTLARQQAAFEKATKIHEFDYGDDPVWDLEGNYYCGGVGELKDVVDPEDQPKWVWAGSKQRLRFDLEDALRQSHEGQGPFDDWEGPDWECTAEFEVAARKFNEAQDHYWWEEDSSRAVLLEPPEWLGDDEDKPEDWPSWTWSE